MRLGVKRHRQLELQVHDLRPIQTETAEEAWACRMVNMIAGIEELLVTGRTRELHVFGRLNPLRYLMQESNDDEIWAIGIIDLIEMRPPSSDLDQSRDESLIPFLVDNKTRTVACIPGFAQKRTSRIQMMLYKFLFDQLVDAESTDTAWISEFLRGRRLDPHASLTSPALRAELGRYGVADCDLLQVCQAAVRAFAAVSRSSNQLQVLYELQGTGAPLGHDLWRFDGDHLQGDVGYFLEFWTGVRGPNPVLSGEAWKCRSCQHRSRCSQSPSQIQQYQQQQQQQHQHLGQ